MSIGYHSIMNACTLKHHLDKEYKTYTTTFAASLSFAGSESKGNPWKLACIHDLRKVGELLLSNEMIRAFDITGSLC